MNQFIVNVIAFAFMVFTIIVAIETDCIMTSKLLAALAIILGTSIINRISIQAFKG